MLASQILLLLGILLATVCPDLVQAGHGHRSIRVKQGQCIQDAINRAQPGDTIYVGPGTYSEYLTISKDGIQLIGKNAKLVAPSKPPVKPNNCVGLAGNQTTAGVCIIGKVTLEKFEKEHRKVSKVERYVTGVRVEGFHIRGFSGLNVAVVGGRRTEVKYNTLEDGPLYGALTVGSISTRIHDNRVKSSGLFFIGICMDDKSDVQVTKNTITDYGIALCIQTNGAKVSGNRVKDCCVGAFIDPGIDGARVTDNDIGASNAKCNPDFGGFATGIVISGTNSKVKNNKVRGTTDGGQPMNIGAGIGIIDQGPVATGNLVTGNILKDNDQDLFVFSNGTNTVTRNKCSTPKELCDA